VLFRRRILDKPASGGQARMTIYDISI